MGNFDGTFSLSVLALAVSSASFAAPPGHAHGSASAHRGYSLQATPGLPGFSSTHVPFVGDQHWGYGGYGRPTRYRGVLAFPFLPFYDLGDYGDPNSYYPPGPDPAEAYGPVPYGAPPMQYSAPELQPMAPPQTGVSHEQAPDPLPPLLVVMQNGQKLQLSNYAVVNGVLWDFSRTAARKIPVSSIDLAASAKATEDAGGEFPQFSSPDASQ